MGFNSGLKGLNELPASVYVVGLGNSQNTAIVL
jgi:hypothetical protein